MAKIVMNPVRIRIAQYLILHEQGTTAQIGEELSDVPKASLYRHMKMLEDAGLIQVVQENKKRGTVEKVYKLNQENPMGGREPGKEEIAQLIHSSCYSILRLNVFNLYNILIFVNNTLPEICQHKKRTAEGASFDSLLIHSPAKSAVL